MDVQIREAVPDDAEFLMSHVRALTAEPDILVPLAPDEFKYTVEEERILLAESKAADNSLFLVAMADGHLVGELTCRAGTAIKAQRHAATLGMSVAPDWRGQGIGARLLSCAIDWAKHSETIKRIELRVFATNERAIHLYTKYGFVQEGLLKKTTYRHGEFHDTAIMALLL